MNGTAHRVGVYGWISGTSRSGVAHFRIAEPLRVLSAHGIRTAVGRELDDEILSTVDTVLVHSLSDEVNSHAWELLAKADSHRLVIDVDDWMWRPDWAVFKRNWTPDALARLYRNVAISHVVTTPSPLIAQYLSRHNRNVHVVPNTVPEWLTCHDMPARPGPTVGYQGSTHHIRNWPPRTQAQLAQFLAAHPAWHVALYGAANAVGPPGRTHTHPWVNDLDAYYRTVSMDIGLGPLKNTPFNRAKSSLRAVEYAALGIVAVLPDLPPYRGWVIPGVTGILYPALRPLASVLAELAADDDWRAAMAANARTCALSWTTEASIRNWVTAWEQNP